MVADGPQPHMGSTYAYCLQPSHLDGVDIRFQVKARLARALIGDRNDLAHRLESQKLRAKIAAFVEIKYRDNKELTRPDKTPETLDEIAHELSINIPYLLGQLTVSETFVKAYLHLRSEMLKNPKSQ